MHMLEEHLVGTLVEKVESWLWFVWRAGCRIHPRLLQLPQADLLWDSRRAEASEADDDRAPPPYRS